MAQERVSFARRDADQAENSLRDAEREAKGAEREYALLRERNPDMWGEMCGFLNLVVIVARLPRKSDCRQVLLSSLSVDIIACPDVDANLGLLSLIRFGHHNSQHGAVPSVMVVP